MSRRWIALLLPLLLAGPASAESISQTPAFSCDVDTNVCSCKGHRDGADCKRMKQDCRDAGGVIDISCDQNNMNCYCCLDGKACTIPPRKPTRSPLGHMAPGHRELAPDPNAPSAPGARPTRARFDDGVDPAFHCDTQTNVCTCDGDRNGTDCKRMQEECKGPTGWPSELRCNASGCACCLDNQQCTNPIPKQARGALPGRGIGTQRLQTTPAPGPGTNPAVTPGVKKMSPRSGPSPATSEPAAPKDEPGLRRFQIQRAPAVD